MSTLKIGYFADGPWSHLALDKLLSDPTISIAFICARFDKPDPVLAARAEREGIAFLTHPKINADDFLAVIDAHRCDLLVSMSFNQIFRQRLIEHAPLRLINCHAGKLPFYRGRNILNWALINDESEFGITVHYVDEGIDTGDIILQGSYPITDADSYATLLERAYVGCAEVLYDAVKLLQANEATRVPQASIHPQGFYCTGRREGDERLSWNQPSRAIFNFVRAVCQPGPEARTWRGPSELRINRVEMVPDALTYVGIPGAVLRVDGPTFLVKTADSFVRVTQWSGVDRVRIGDRLS